uniref:Translation initiation factor 3 N-terminal domain-containing protein n=1 Tax=Zea mays TaxID=4577 RepID=B6SGV1_MAIZE|nr:hypothetical protein [Zea mays]
MALRRNAGSLALRAAAYLRRHRPHPPPPLALAAPAPTPIRSPLAPPFRHFAAPPGTQTNRKRGKEEDDASAGPRMNNAIAAPFVRLVMDEGHNILPRHEALQLAIRMDMDLVEVATCYKGINTNMKVANMELAMLPESDNGQGRLDQTMINPAAETRNC